jgi:ABC-type Mn2+/Zn2+ transport system permease subunit
MVSLAKVFMGIYFSYIYNISTGAMIVIVNLVLFIVFTLIDKIVYE